MQHYEYRPALLTDWQIAATLQGEVIGLPIRQGRSAGHRQNFKIRAGYIKRKMMEMMGVEDIVEDYTSHAIKAIQSKTCDFCGVGNWRVILMQATAHEGLKIGFRMTAAVQCGHCLGIDRREWNFDPFSVDFEVKK